MSYGNSLYFFGTIWENPQRSNANEKPFETLPYQACNLVDR
jgi:hypothetical protein